MDDNNALQKTSRGRYVVVMVGLYALWFFWVAVIHPLKLTNFVDAPKTREDIESYAMFGGLIKAFLVVSPYWCIKAILKRL